MGDCQRLAEWGVERRFRFESLAHELLHESPDDVAFHRGMACEVVLVDGVDEHAIADFQQVDEADEHIVMADDVTVGDRQDDGQIGGDELIADLVSRGKMTADLFHVSDAGCAAIERGAQGLGLESQIVHADGQRLLVAAWQDGLTV